MIKRKKYYCKRCKIFRFDLMEPFACPKCGFGMEAIESLDCPKTHDYTDRVWGHDYIINNVHNGGETLDMMGWGYGLEKGDYIIIPNGSETTRYQLMAVEYFSDPRDMWKAKAKFAPRTKP